MFQFYHRPFRNRHIYALSKRHFWFWGKGVLSNPFKRTSAPLMGPAPKAPTAKEHCIQMYDYIGNIAAKKRFERDGWVVNFFFWNAIAIPAGYVGNTMTHLFPTEMWVDWIFWASVAFPNAAYYLKARPWFGSHWTTTLFMHGLVIPWFAFYGAVIGVMWSQRVLGDSNPLRAFANLSGVAFFVYWRFWPNHRINQLITKTFQKANIKSHARAQKRKQELKDWRIKKKSLRKDWWLDL